MVDEQMLGDGPLDTRYQSKATAHRHPFREGGV